MIDFVGYKWSVVCQSEVRKQGFNRNWHVYMITSMVVDERKILYIGSSTSMTNRMSAHSVLRELKSANVDDKIDILFVEIYDDQNALLIERTLIKEYNPPFNLMSKSIASYPISKMWDDLCVDSTGGNLRMNDYSKMGRKSKPDEEKVAMVPVYAKKMHHEALAQKFQPLIKKEEIKLDKEVKQ